MSDRLFSLRLFVRIARTGSFSTAGRELGVSQPSASRIIATLEHEVGAALFTRTTRAVALTEAGVGYLEKVEPLLVALEEADHSVRGTGELRGLLRVAMSPTFAVREAIPRLGRFADRHPALRIQLVVGDEKADLVGASIDVAVRIGPLVDSTAVARCIAVSRRVVAAAPSYLAAAGCPRTPRDLRAHALIAGPAAHSPEGWMFEKGDRSVALRVAPRFLLDSTEAATAMAVNGLGIVSAGALSCRAELENGALVRVLPDWDMGAVPVNVILPGGRAAKPSARAFVDFISAEMAPIREPNKS